jgi:hypothetical protein
MSDQDATTAEAAEEATEEQQQNTDATTEQESPEDDSNQAWDPERAMRKISKVNSENKALRDRATKAEEKAKSADDLTKENGGLKATVLQLEVGYELGLPMAIAKRLQGSTREEMLADAEALVELVSPAKKQPATRRPTEALRGGLEPDKEPEETDLSKLGARMFRR